MVVAEGPKYSEIGFILFLVTPSKLWLIEEDWSKHFKNPHKPDKI